MPEQKKIQFLARFRTENSGRPFPVIAVIAVLTVFFAFMIVKYIQVDSDVKNHS